MVLPCSGLTDLDRSRVSELVWLCYGCMESIIVSAEAAVETRLLHWQEGVTTVFHKHGRLRLLEDTLSLQYEPVEVKDSGEYVCKVNGQIDTGGLVRLIVQGE